MTCDLVMSCSGCGRVGTVDAKRIGRHAIFCPVCRRPMVGAPRQLIADMLSRHGVIAS